MKSVLPGKIDGRVRAPASKSMMIRAVAAAALAKGKSTVKNPSDCDDAKAAIGCARALGAEVGFGKEIVEIVGGAKPLSTLLNCGESGLCIRMFAPIAALFDREIKLAASGSLMKRSVGIVQEPLEKLGAECKTDGGLPPIKVRGPMRGGKVSIDGSQSSQFLTGLLMALPLCRKSSVLGVCNLKSKPYVRMTMELIGEFGVRVAANDELSSFSVAGGQEYRPSEYEVEGDWSGAAFLLVAGAIAGKVLVRGLRNDSKQADRSVVDALQAAGAGVKLRGDAADVETARLSAFEFDATDCPDLFPPLAVLACFCNGKSVLKGVERLGGKESDRASTLASELGKMGAKICVKGNALEIEGGNLRGGSVDSLGDHRIAMACAIAGLASEKGAEIKNPDCVSKSYPGFFRDLEKMRVE